MIRNPMAALTVAAATLVASPGPSEAGPFTDDLARCLVRATSESERVDLVRWIVAAITVHPGVRGMTGISDDRRTAETRLAANLFGELIAVRCRNEARDAIKFEGESAFEAAFTVLGQVAMQTLMGDAAVNAEMTRLGEMLDEDMLNELLQAR